MYIFVHNYTSFFQKIKFPSSGEHTGYKPIYWAHYLSLPNGFSVNVLQAGNTKCNKRWSPQFISQSLNKALCSAAHLPLSKASVVVAHGHEQKQKVTMFHSREVIICTNLNLGINTWEHFLHQNSFSVLYKSKLFLSGQHCVTYLVVLMWIYGFGGVFCFEVFFTFSRASILHSWS